MNNIEMYSRVSADIVIAIFRVNMYYQVETETSFETQDNFQLLASLIPENQIITTISNREKLRTSESIGEDICGWRTRQLQMQMKQINDDEVGRINSENDEEDS